ncbi:MAG: hypothetical protein F6K42_21415 [Leptolyngbya sp. SIO1D8]|nr:hypothetical protein [Leptolyngbya sp. SIO1D8]
MMKPVNPRVPLSRERLIELEMLYTVLMDEIPYPWKAFAHSTVAKWEVNPELPRSPNEELESQWKQLSQQAEKLWSEHSKPLLSQTNTSSKKHGQFHPPNDEMFSTT